MKILSVTQVLSVFFDKTAIDSRALAAAAQRGIDVHLACAAYAKMLPMLFVHEAIEGYVISFRRWFDRYVKLAVAVEVEFVDTKIYYIKGHPDLVAQLIDGRWVVPDYKTPRSEARTWRAQLAAYRYLVKQALNIDCEPMALRLDPDGGEAKASLYKTESADFAAFVAALTAYRYFKG